MRLVIDERENRPSIAKTHSGEPNYPSLPFENAYEYWSAEVVVSFHECSHNYSENSTINPPPSLTPHYREPVW